VIGSVMTEVGLSLRGRRRHSLARLRDPEVQPIGVSAGTASSASALSLSKPCSRLRDGNSW
jgi:hypothetical protein